MYRAPSAPSEPDFSTYTPPVNSPAPTMDAPVSLPTYVGGPWVDSSNTAPAIQNQRTPRSPGSNNEGSSPSVPLTGNIGTKNPTTETQARPGPTATPAAALPVQNLVASGSAGAVNLSWTASESGVTYSIDRATSPSGPFTPLASGLTETSYTDTAVVNGVRYYYRVHSMNASGGGISNIANAIPSDLPTAPALVVAATNSSASLSWAASTGLGAITYSVERSLTPSSGYAVVTSGLGTTTFSDSSVTNGTLYYYRVQAHNLAGGSDYSNEVPAKPIASFLAGTATAGKTSVAVTWNSATGASQYDVKYGTTSGVYTGTLSNQTSPATVTGLTAGTTYYFSVNASNSQNGLTPSTNELSAIPLGSFSITSITAVGIGQLKLTWGASTGATSYDIQCGTSSGTYTITASNQTSPATLSSLSDGTTYYCAVIAKNSTGSTSSAEVSTATMSPLTYTWPFDAGTDASYSFDSSKLELVGGVSRLKNSTPQDASFIGNDFKDATLSGLKWDSVNSKLTLDPLSNDGELNSQWTPHYDRIVGYWKLNGTAGSSLTQGALVRATIGSDGAVQNANGTGLSYVDGPQRQGLSFDATDDYIEIPDQPELNPGTGDFTLQMWLSSTSAAASNVFVGKYGGGSTDDYWFGLNSGQANISFTQNLGACAGGITNGPLINDGKFHHLLATRKANVVSLYVDGVKVGTAANNCSVSPIGPLRIGTGNGWGSHSAGLVDEVAVWSTGMSDQEAKLIYERQSSRYSGTILSRVMSSGSSTAWQGLNYLTQYPYGKELSPSLDSALMVGIQGLWHLNETTTGTAPSGTDFKDEIGSNHGTKGSSASLNRDGKFRSGVKLDGTSNSYVSIPDSNSLSPWTSGGMSICSWVKPTTILPTTWNPIVAKGTSGNYEYALNLNNDGRPMFIFWTSAGATHTGVNATTGNVAVVGAWSHVCGTFNEGVATKIYLNGVLVGTSTVFNANVITNGTSPVNFGRRPDLAAGQNFNGTIDEVAMWNRELSSSEVNLLYQRGAGKILFQARTCANADCSDDLSGANWKGSAGTSGSYFSELNNTTASNPQFLFSNFGFSLTNQPYFQYRAVFGSDSLASSPDLLSVSAGPARYDGSNPTIIPVDGPKYQIYTGFTTTPGSSCSGTPRFQLSHDKKTWYYYSSGMWNTTTSGITQASDSATINSNISTFSAVAGTGELYAKIFYPSDTTTACEINSVAVSGYDLNNNTSDNPNSFEITSISANSGSTTLAWNAATDATSYKVCYGTTQALANACATYVTVTGTSTTITGLTNDTHYYFTVVASNSSGVTASNSPTSVTPIAVPSTPASLIAKTGIAVINLAWSASSGSSTITYTVKRATVSGGPYTTLSSGISANAYTDTSATPGTPYYYVVSASNYAGSSANSNEASSTAMSEVNYTWTFDQGTDSSYSFDSSKVELQGGVCRLKNATPTDASYTVNDFASATLSGLKWDSASSAITLDSNSDDGELNGNWTPKFDKIVGYWKMNGTSGTSNAQGTVIPAAIGPDGVVQNANGTGMRWVGGIQRESMDFDGSDDSIRVPHQTSLSPTGSATFQFWVNYKSFGWSDLLQKGIGTANAQYYIRPRADTPSIDFAFTNGVRSFVLNVSNANLGLAIGKWSHIMFVCDDVAQTAKVYANGVLVGTGTVSSNIRAANTVPLTIGGYTWDGNTNAKLDEVAIWSDALSANEVKTVYERQQARYSGTILSRVMSSGPSTSWSGINYLTSLPYGKELSNTVETNYSNTLAQSMVGFWHMDESAAGTAPGGKDFKDASGNGVHGTVNNAANFTFGQAGALIKAPLINDGHTEFNAPAGTFSSGVATTSFWMYWDGTNSRMPFGFVYYNLYLYNGFIGFNTGNSDLLGASSAGLANRWVHVVAEFHAGNVTLNKLYLDGVQQTLTQAMGLPAAVNANLATTFAISGWTGAASYRMTNSSIDEVGVWNRALTPAEITQLYLNQTDLTTGLVGLWHFNETSAGTAPGGKDFADASGNGNHGVNTSLTIGASGKFGNSIRSNGAGGVKIPLDLSNTKVASVSLWYNSDAYYAPSTAQAKILFEFGPDFNSGSGGFLATIGDCTNSSAFPCGSQSVAMRGNGGYRIASGPTISIPGWHHYVYVFDRSVIPNQILEYKDGVQVALTTSGGIYSTSSTNVFGSSDLYLLSRNLSQFIGSGSMDEVGVWSRALSASEAQQLYQRGANNIQVQARSCANADCSDDPNGTNWKGSDGTFNTYFSEASNSSSSNPNFLFGDFGFSLASTPYFQYRAVLTSDSASLSPGLKSVSAGPARFDGTNPTIIPVNGPSFQTLTSFTVTLGAGGCSSVPKFQLSTDKTNWYYYTGSMWAAATAGITQASTASAISSNISTLKSVTGVGKLYVKAFLPSSTSTACEIDAIAVNGADFNPSNSSNPNAFQVTSTSSGNGSANLTWNASSGATSYTICYGTTQAAADSCASSVTVAGTSTTVTGLTNNTTYFFTVNAIGSGGRTPASTSTTTTPMAPPSVPASLTSSASLYTVQLNWAASSGTGPITYTVKRGTSSGSYTTLATGLTANAFTDFTALAGNTYYYVVTSNNLGGASANSNETIAVPLGSFSITSGTAAVQSATIAWGAAVGAANYSISYGTGSANYSTTLTNQTSPTTITGLTAGTKYYFLVTAKNAAGASSASQEVSVTPTQTFTYDWPFTNGTDSSYNFDNTLISVANNACRLTPITWTDNDDIAAGYAGGTKYGLTWSSNKLVLDTTGSQKALNAGWTPQYGNIVHYWTLDGTSGSALADGATISASVSASTITAHNANGTGMGFVSGKVNTAVTFDGVDDYLTGTHTGWSPGTGDFSIGYWIKVSGAIPGNFRVFSKRNDCGHSSFFSTMVQASGAPSFEVDEDAVGTNYKSLVGSTAVNDGNWHFISFVRQATQLMIYVDGKLDVTGTTPGTTNITNTSVYDFGAISACSVITQAPFSLDSVAVWSSALSADEVRVIYEHQQQAYSGTFISRIFDASPAVPWSGFSWTTSQPFGKEITASAESTSGYSSVSTSLQTGLVGIWHLNETAAGTAPGGKDLIDSSGNGYHASVDAPSGYTFNQTGRFNKAVGMAGGSTRINVPGATYSTGVATFSFWMYWKGQQQVMPIGLYLYDLYLGYGYMGYNTASGDVFGIDDTGLANRWVHVVAEFHAGDYNANKLYIDGVSQTLTQKMGSQSPSRANLEGYFNLNGWLSSSGYRMTDGSLMDEVISWNRTLTAAEVTQLYQRGANRVKFQVRYCAYNDCSEDDAATKWKGPDGTANTYYSELNNSTLSTPAMNFESLGVATPTASFIQYKAILESDSDPAVAGPDLKTVTVGPIYDKSAPAIFTVNGSAYVTLTGFTVTLGSGGCTDTPKFQFSKDKTNWYYHNGSTWVTASGYMQANTASEANTNISTLPGVIGTGTIYVRSFLNSTGSHACEIDNINVTGTK